MFIIYGTRLTERTTGFVADYCPLCRMIREFRLVRLGKISHLYYISIGAGTLIGYNVECQSCSMRIPVDPIVYSEFLSDSGRDIFELETRTNPALRHRNAERIASDARVLSGGTVPDSQSRRERILEVFSLLNPAVVQRFANSTKFDRPAGMGCFGTVIVGALVFWYAFTLPFGERDPAALTALGILVCGAIYTFVQLHFAPSRYVQAKVAPLLTKGLRPLQPTQDELASALETCKRVDMTIARHFKAERLWLDLQRSAA